MGRDLLSPIERAQICIVRASLRPGWLDQTVRFLQSNVGQRWIRATTASLRTVHGLDRLPPWDPSKSVLCVCNHRTFFDLYVVTAELVARGLPYRILFPVRSTFFFDNPIGLLINGTVSFFAMYPPIFRDRKRSALNLASLDEMARLLRRGGIFLGIHPEGTRNKDGDPYELLPAQPGVGRLIRRAQATVIPVFVNGLSNDFLRQVASGVRGTGDRIHVVFGAPIEFGTLAQAPDNPRTHRQIAEHCRAAIGLLAQEERFLRSGSAAPDRRQDGHGAHP
jgi:1-acyl-sn-glycerol-3-phosphate acyltransferase